LLLAQYGTILERVERARPGPLVVRTLEGEFAVPSFELAIKDSDLVLVGSLTRPVAYLSADQMTLYTDYEVVPANIVSARSTLPTARPGQPSIVVRTYGGDTIINGVRVTIVNDSMLPLPTDKPLLLFLTFNKQAGKYEIYHQRTWVFGLEDISGAVKLKPLVTEPQAFEERVRSMGVEETIAEVQSRYVK
jgi:hypothetical protein